MCGRFTLTVSDIAALARAWGAEVDEALRAAWHPRFNVAPGDLVPLLRQEAGRRRLVAAAFGLPSRGGGLHVNARSETAARTTAFRDALAHARAAVPADGFFEWEGPAGDRRPSWLHRADGAPLLFAAVAAPGPGGAPAFAILTEDAVDPVVRLHDRQPVILPPALVDRWLADGPPPPLPPAEPGMLAARPVSRRVNSATNDDAGCLGAPEEPEQGRLF
ncbi:MAG TPA: SOS response-associated peptidase [Anaeromyxobacteraceae bacterium]|nr:SOS response-associated peptidase [Anaeromyxobacteraceae bacterium]